MVRWHGDSRQRLLQSAFHLFEMQGFDATTTADIAKGAGLTERTFFRYFASKRDLPFDGLDTIIESLRTAVAAAPRDQSPAERVCAGLTTMTIVANSLRETIQQARTLICENPGLRERAAGKRSELVAALETDLRRKGGGALEASIAAEIGASIFTFTLSSWSKPTSVTPWAECLRRVSDQFRLVCGTTAPASIAECKTTYESRIHV